MNRAVPFPNPSTHESCGFHDSNPIMVYHACGSRCAAPGPANMPDRLVVDVLFDCARAASDLEALQAARKMAPDLLFSDVLMPHLSGIELAILARKDCPTAKCSCSPEILVLCYSQLEILAVVTCVFPSARFIPDVPLRVNTRGTPEPGKN